MYNKENDMTHKAFCFSFMLSTLLVIVAFAGDKNILTNPGFEKGREGWYDRTCAIEAVASPVHSGTGSCKVINRLANWQGVKQSIFGKLAEGKVYKVSAWVKLDNAKSDVVAISVEQQDDAGTKYIGVARDTVTDSTWTQLSGEFTLKVTGALSVLDVYFEGPAPGVNFYVDDASVYGPEVVAAAAIAVKPEGKGLIDVGTRYQNIEGFGASGAWYTRDVVNHKKKDELYNLLFKELGLDIFRISNYYDTDPNSFREAIEIAKNGRAALGRDLKIMISSWSPPPRLKSNGKIVGGTLKKSSGKFMYDEFAQWWYNAVALCTKEGIKVDYVSIQNEPDYEAPYNSCIFVPAETSDAEAAAYDKAFEAVWQKLHAEMGSGMPKMLAPETSSLGQAKRYIENLKNLSHIYGYAHHLYDCSGCALAPDRFIPSMSSFAGFNKQHDDKPLFQTEFADAALTWKNAISAALVIHNALTVEGVTSYMYWDLFWGPDSGLVSINNSSSYTINPPYYAFKQYSAFIDDGWQRVDASTDNAGIKISAYISPDNKKLTAIIINTTTDTDIALDLSFKNLSISKGEAYRSSQKENCVLVGSYNAKAPLEIPAYSVTTLSLFAGAK
jgi:glucuronoarabinoxylan endo-1,4-beta-xylanase